LAAVLASASTAPTASAPAATPDRFIVGSPSVVVGQGTNSPTCGATAAAPAKNHYLSGSFAKSIVWAAHAGWSAPLTGYPWALMVLLFAGGVMALFCNAVLAILVWGKSSRTAVSSRGLLASMDHDRREIAYNAAIALTSTNSSSRTRRSTMSNVLGG